MANDTFKKQGLPIPARIAPYLVLALMLAASVWFWRFWANAEETRVRDHFNEYCEEISRDITQRLNTYTMMLHGGAGVFFASEEVTREEWRAYYEYHQGRTLPAGIQGISFLKAVAPSELARHVENIRAEGFPEYSVWPDGERAFYTPVVFNEPSNARNRQALGYDRLRELEELRDNLIHMIVHDMRTPLTGILGYAEFLLEELKKLGHDGLATDAGEILATGRRLRDMITTLLDISRMESNEMPLEKATCDLREVVADAMASLGAIVNDSTVLFEPPGDGMAAICDPEICRRVVTNLVANAIKFTRRTGDVRVGLDRVPEGLRVTVCDTGPGIPPEYHERIFEKFGQVAARNEGKEYSSGLGLTFCKLAVEAHGGRIGVDSEVGKGSTFWFILPAAG